MTQFCENCGKPHKVGEKFCRYCGNRLIMDQAPPVNQTPPYNQAPPYAAPQYTAPQTAAKPRRRGKKSAALTITAVVLAVTLVAECVISAIWFPGFFNSGAVKEAEVFVEADDDAEPSVVDLANYWTPPDVKDYNIEYSEQEIADAPATSMQVSPSSPKASQGRFSVEFAPWELSAEDTFTVKELPVHSDDEAGYNTRGFDLSLASGKSRFSFDVAVTVPREESDGEIVYFLAKNPETGENETEYYEISDDGKSYLLYTKHFSGHILATPKQMAQKLINDVKNRDVSETSTRQALSAFYYPTKVKWNERVTAPVRYSNYDFWKKVSKQTTFLPDTDSLLEALKVKVEKDGAKSVNIGGSLFNTSKEVGEKALEFVDTANNAKGGAVDGTVKLMEALKVNKVSPGLEKALANYNGLGDKMAVPAAHLSGLTTIAGYVMLDRQIVKEIEQGKFKDDRAAQWEHRSECASTILGSIGTLSGYVYAGSLTAAKGTALAAAGGPASIVAIVCSLGALTIYCYVKANQPKYEALDVYEQNYRDYFYRDNNASACRAFFYDYDGADLGWRFDKTKKTYMPRDNDVESGIGNIRRISVLTDKQNEEFKRYINVEMKEINDAGGIVGSDPRVGAMRLDFITALQCLFGIVGRDNPEKVYDAIIEFVQNYADACWDNLTEGDYLAFCRENMKRRNQDADSASLPWQTDTEKENIQKKYRDRFVQELFDASKDALFSMFRCFQHDAEREVDTMIEQELLPLLNTQMEFTVEDPSLENPKDFAKSVYNTGLRDTGVRELYRTETGGYTDYSKSYESPMYFCIQDASGNTERVRVPLFLPSMNWSTSTEYYGSVAVGLHLARTEYEDFYPAKKNFLPKLAENTENTVFRCTYYHYLMMGAPNAMSFKNLNDKDAQESVVPFEVHAADADGVIRVNIGGAKADTGNLEQFVGTWEGEREILPSASWEHFDKKTQTVKVEIAIAEGQSLDFSIYLDGSKLSLDSQKYSPGDDKGKGYYLKGSTLYIYYNKDAKGGESFGGNYAYKMTGGGGTMTLSTIEQHYWEEGRMYYIEPYECSALLGKTK